MAHMPYWGCSRMVSFVVRLILADDGRGKLT